MSTKAATNNRQNTTITKNKKHEWSKIFTTGVALLVGIYGIWCGIEYYRLCKLAIQNNTTLPDAGLAITCVSIVLASLLSYCLYNGALKTSLNRNHLTIDENGIIHPLLGEALNSEEKTENTEDLDMGSDCDCN